MLGRRYVRISWSSLWEGLLLEDLSWQSFLGLVKASLPERPVEGGGRTAKSAHRSVLKAFVADNLSLTSNEARTPKIRLLAWPQVG